MKTTNLQGCNNRPKCFSIFLETSIRSFRKESKTEIDQKVFDAIIVDFLNYVTSSIGIESDMYTSDLENQDVNESREFELDFDLSRRILQKRADEYKKSDICKSVLKNNMNDCEESFKQELGEIVIDNLLTYVLKFL